MAQTPALYRQEGDHIDYLPNSDVASGDVVVTQRRVGIATQPIPANTLGSLTIEGVFRVPKVTGAIADGQSVYWNPTASPVTGTAGSGAAQASGSGGYLMGPSFSAALSGDSYVDVVLTPGIGTTAPVTSSTTTAAAGTSQADAAAVSEGFNLVTGADATKGVVLPAATAGHQVTIKNDDAANAVLKVYPAVGDAINALAANAALSMPAKTSATFTAVDATTWYTTPLVPS